MSEWKPIDTAPKDARVFVGLLPDKTIRFVAWCKTIHVPLYGWRLVDQGAAENCDLCEPTHWLEVPELPSK